jgi:hypothetical protein
LRPHLIEVGAQARHSFGIQLVQPRVPAFVSITSPASLSTRRCCETAGRLTGIVLAKLVYREGAAASFLEDRHARGIAKGVESGL